MNCVNAIKAVYPADIDKVRLWRDIKSHRFVTALLNVPNFKNYIEQQVLLNPAWPDYDVMHAAVTNITDNQRQLSNADYGELMANAAMQRGPCSNCAGTHVSRDCRKKPNRVL